MDCFDDDGDFYYYYYSDFQTIEMMSYYCCYAIAVAAILLTLMSNWIEMIRSVAFLIVVYSAAVLSLRLAEYSQREEAAEAAATSYVAAAVEVMQLPWKVLVAFYS